MNGDECGRIAIKIHVPRRISGLHIGTRANVNASRDEHPETRNTRMKSRSTL
jgi:hypothetical protein